MTNTEIALADKIMLGVQYASAMYIGDTLIWGRKTPVYGLPLGYTELEYISSGSQEMQYIDLNKQLYATYPPNFSYEIKFNHRGGVGQATMFGCQDPSSPYPGLFIRRQLSDVVYKNGNGNNVTCGTLELVITLNYDGSTNGYNVASGTTHQYGTSLFCAFSDLNKTPDRCCIADLYYFKLYENGILTRDMVPCKNPNDEVGMYDRVEGVFYPSSGQRAFHAGPVVLPLFEVWADQTCTQRPIVGLSYETLYVKCNVDVQLNHSTSFGSGNDTLYVDTPAANNPDGPFSILLWTDWVSDDIYGYISEDSVIEVNYAPPSGDPPVVMADDTFDFYGDRLFFT